MKSKRMVNIIAAGACAAAFSFAGHAQTTQPPASGGGTAGGTVRVQNNGGNQSQTTISTTTLPQTQTTIQRGEGISPALQQRIQAQQSGQTIVPNSAGQLNATNGFAGTNGAFRTNTPGWSPTGNVNATNRLYGSNWNSANGSFSNRTTTAFQDTALTTTDRSLLVQVRQTVIARLQPSGAWSPAVHFQINNGIVTLLGVVTSIQISQQIETTVTQVPGVVRVVNRLMVGTGANTTTTIQTNNNF